MLWLHFSQINKRDRDLLGCDAVLLSQVLLRVSTSIGMEGALSSAYALSSWSMILATPWVFFSSLFNSASDSGLESFFGLFGNYLELVLSGWPLFWLSPTYFAIRKVEFPLACLNCPYFRALKPPAL